MWPDIYTHNLSLFLSLTLTHTQRPLFVMHSSSSCRVEEGSEGYQSDLSLGQGGRSRSTGSSERGAPLGEAVGLGKEEGYD